MKKLQIAVLALIAHATVAAPADSLPSDLQAAIADTRSALSKAADAKSRWAIWQKMAERSRAETSPKTRTTDLKRFAAWANFREAVDNVDHARFLKGECAALRDSILQGFAVRTESEEKELGRPVREAIELLALACASAPVKP
jgi:hypothetical protein